MPHTLHSLRVETHTNSAETNHPSPLTINSAAARRLFAAVMWSRNDTSVSTPTLRYGGISMSRNVPQTIGDGSTRASLVLFDLDNTEISSAQSVSNTFSLSWSGGTPQIHGSAVWALSSFLSSTVSGSNTGTGGGTADTLTTGHTSTSSSRIYGLSILHTTNVVSPAWRVEATIPTELTTTIGSGTGRFRFSFATYTHSGSDRTLSIVSSGGGSVRRAQFSIRMRDNGDPPPNLPSSLSISISALASDYFETYYRKSSLDELAYAYESVNQKADAITLLHEQPVAVDYFDSVFFTPGVNSCQYFCQIQNSSREWIDVSDDISAINIYRQASDLFSKIRAGEAYIKLHNESGRYSQESQSRAHDLVLTREARIFATYYTNTHHMFNGAIESFSSDADLSNRYFTIKAKDQIKKAESVTITTSLFENYQVNSYVADVISKTEITPSSVDIITNTIPVAWAARRVGLNVLEEIIESGAYSAYVDGQGVFNFRNRNYELTASNRISTDEFFTLKYSKDTEKLANKITVGGERRKVTTDVHTLTYIEEPIYIGPGNVKNFFLSYFDYQTRDPVPATGIVVPVSSQDILLYDTSSATGANLTNTASWWLEQFAESSKCYIYNGSASESWLTKFQIRGRPARKEPSISVLREVSSSQAVYGVRDFAIDNKFIQDIEFAADYADFLKQRYEDPEPVFNLSLRYGNASARLDPGDSFNACQIEIGDRITITNSFFGFSTTGFVVKHIEHDITVDRGVIHDLTLLVEKPRWDESLILFRLDDPILGVLNGSGQLVF